MAKNLIDRRTYAAAIKKFKSFRDLYKLQHIWPVPLSDLLYFIAFLSLEGLSASSVNTFISAIAHVHKIQNIQETNTNSFLVRKAIEGLRRENGGSNLDIRLPITIDLLDKILSCLHSICSNTYEASLFAAAFSLSFFGLLRVGELTEHNNKSYNKKVLKLQDILLQPSQLCLVIRWSKTDQTGKSVTLSIPSSGGIHCPVMLMRHYLQARPVCSNDHLFIHFNTKSLTRYQFSTILRKALKFLDVPGHLRSHSFRIGGATQLALAGVPD